MDAATEEMETARTGAAKAAAKKKVDELQAKYDQTFSEHRELQKNYNEAKAAAAREEEITAFSLGIRSLANIRDLSGDVHSKEVTVRVKEKSGTSRNYRFHLRQYVLKDPATSMNLKGRWVIVKSEAAA